ncbi:hypothetical protein ACFQVC_06530 [Streptomyces monticola]|uniref:Uncharacterized protein n=1 Tax=Streptomyces monticola TaxID=2666263 RepID=A0ABW2JDW1_9ACTN
MSGEQNAGGHSAGGDGAGGHGARDAAGDAEEFCARVQAAAGTSYRSRRTDRGFDLAVDVPQPGRHSQKVHTYRVGLHAQEKTFEMTDVSRTDERGPGGLKGRTVESGRFRSRTWSRSLDGSERHSFSTADGHRLIRGVAEELGWQESRPAGAKAGLAFGVIGGLWPSAR